MQLYQEKKQVFSCEYYEIYKNTFLQKKLMDTASTFLFSIGLLIFWCISDLMQWNPYSFVIFNALYHYYYLFLTIPSRHLPAQS